MKIRRLYQGKESLFDSPQTTVVIGRPKLGLTIDLDLTPDESVSRPHARLSFSENQWWIEDLGSRCGTQVNGREIKSHGQTPLATLSNVQVGQTLLKLDTCAGQGESLLKSIAEKSFPPFAHDKTVNVALAVPAAVAPVDLRNSAPSADRQQRLQYDLLVQLATSASLEQLLEDTIERLLDIIPGAQRGAILIKETKTGELYLRAHRAPPGAQPACVTLAEDVMRGREGFIWHRGQGHDVSQAELQSGMYAPLLLGGETLGVVCVDNHETSIAFRRDDLDLLVAVGHYIALAISNHSLREELREHAAVLQRLLTNFSPAVRRRLLERARNGTLRLGSVRSEVTILFSDMRGFTRTAAAMDVDDVEDMLNQYFSVLVDAIFQHQGTVDRFDGDAILAVFGSPEPDKDHYAKAIGAALAMEHALEEVNQARLARGRQICEIGIGIHCGQVLHGFIGSEERMQFALTGDPVNRASRFCAGAQGGQILISHELYEHIWRLVRVEETSITTKHEGELKAWRVIGRKDIQEPPA